MLIENESRETLVAALREWGVRFLAPSDARSLPEPLAPEELISRLAGHSDPRLRLALVPLFILHPELTNLLPLISQPLAGHENLMKLYTAAACLQRMWSIRLGFYLRNVHLLPDLYSVKLGLPPADALGGKHCLYALAERETFSQLSAYEGVIEMLFAQLKEEAQYEPTPAG